MSANDAARRLGAPSCAICKKVGVEIEPRSFRAPEPIVNRARNMPRDRVFPVEKPDFTAPLKVWRGDACAGCWIDFLRARLQEEQRLDPDSFVADPE